MKNYLRNRAEKKLISKQKKVAYKGLDFSKTALILFKNETPNNTAMALRLDELMKKHRVKTTFLGYVTSKLKKEEVLPDGYYQKLDLKWSGAVKDNVLNKINKNTFDILFNLDADIKSPNSFILSAVSAGLKVGFDHDHHAYDFMIEKKNFNEDELMSYLENYLNNINKV